MYERHITGSNGEDFATQFLLDYGYKICERNYRCKLGEIDIVALDKDEIVFVEVKTRTQSKFGMPADAVDGRKKNHIYRVAEYYVMVNQLEDKFMRFDVIEVYVDFSGKARISHIKNAIMDVPKFTKRDEYDLEEIEN